MHASAVVSGKNCPQPGITGDDTVAPTAIGRRCRCRAARFRQRPSSSAHQTRAGTDARIAVCRTVEHFITAAAVLYLCCQHPLPFHTLTLNFVNYALISIYMYKIVHIISCTCTCELVCSYWFAVHVHSSIIVWRHRSHSIPFSYH